MLINNGSFMNLALMKFWWIMREIQDFKHIRTTLNILRHCSVMIDKKEINKY